MDTQILSCLNTKQFSLSSIERDLFSLWSNNRIKWLITSYIEFVTTKKKLLMTHKIPRKSKAQTNLSPFRTDKHNYAITQSWLTTKNVTTIQPILRLYVYGLRLMFGKLCVSSYIILNRKTNQTQSQSDCRHHRNILSHCHSHTQVMLIDVLVSITSEEWHWNC